MGKKNLLKGNLLFQRRRLLHFDERFLGGRVNFHATLKGRFLMAKDLLPV